MKNILLCYNTSEYIDVKKKNPYKISKVIRNIIINIIGYEMKKL